MFFILQSIVSSTNCISLSVIANTTLATLAYIGHSQGTVIMFGLLSTRPEYSNKIKPFIAMAPVTSVGNIKTLFKALKIGAFIKFKPGPFSLHHPVSKKKHQLSCLPIVGFLHGLRNFIMSGLDVQGLNFTRLPVYYATSPAGTSIWNILHYLQSCRTNTFSYFDYGIELNIQKYSSFEPPPYPIDAIYSSKIITYRAVKDILSTPEDFEILKQKLKGLCF